MVKFVFETPVFLSFGYHRVSFTWEIFWLCAVGEQRSRENSRLQVYVLFNRTLDLLCTILKTLRAARAQFSLSSDFEWITSEFLFPEKKINLCFYCVRRRVAKFVPSKFFNIALWPSSHGEWWVLFFLQNPNLIYSTFVLNKISLRRKETMKMNSTLIFASQIGLISCILDYFIMFFVSTFCSLDFCTTSWIKSI